MTDVMFKPFVILAAILKINRSKAAQPKLLSLLPCIYRIKTIAKAVLLACCSLIAINRISCFKIYDQELAGNLALKYSEVRNHKSPILVITICRNVPSGTVGCLEQRNRF